MYGDDGSVPTRLNRYASPVFSDEDEDDEGLTMPYHYYGPGIFAITRYAENVDGYSVQAAASDDDDDDELAYDLGAYDDDDDAEDNGTDYGAYDEY